MAGPDRPGPSPIETPANRPGAGGDCRCGGAGAAAAMSLVVLVAVWVRLRDGVQGGSLAGWNHVK